MYIHVAAHCTIHMLPWYHEPHLTPHLEPSSPSNNKNIKAVSITIWLHIFCAHFDYTDTGYPIPVPSSVFIRIRYNEFSRYVTNECTVTEKTKIRICISVSTFPGSVLWVSPTCPHLLEVVYHRYFTHSPPLKKLCLCWRPDSARGSLTIHGFSPRSKRRQHQPSDLQSARAR